jgi:hypothetical protein
MNCSPSALGAAALCLCVPWSDQEDSHLFQSLASLVPDWTGLGDLVARAHCAPIAVRNLQYLSDSPVPADETAVLVQVSREAVMRNMLNEAELRHLNENLFWPEGIDCVHVKGASLGRRYYPDPTLRMHRDIDILLRDEDRLKAIRFGVRNGYRFFVAGRELTVKRDADVSALFEFGREVAMVSPQWAVIELHKSIDKAMGIFPPERLFEVSQVHDLQGGPMRVLPTNWLFCYLAYHACQHNWTKLIWMIDLIVLMRAKDFSWPEASEIAGRAGVQAMVEGAFRAAIHLEGMDGAGLIAGSSTGMSKAAQIVEAVIRENGLSADGIDVATGTHRPDMSGALWLGDGWKGLKFGLNRLAYLSLPSLEDYRLLPLNAGRWHLHYFLRPLLFAYRRVRAVIGRKC